MSIWSLTCQQSVFKRYHTDKHFSEFSPTRRRQKWTDIDMEQIYVTVTLCILRRSCFWHCYTVYAQKLHLKRVKVNLNWELTLKFHKYAKALCSTKSTVGLFFNFPATKRAVRPIKSKSQRFTFIVLVKRQKGVIFWYVSDRQTVRCCEHCLRHLSLSTATSYDITLTRIRIAQWKPNYSHYVKKINKTPGRIRELITLCGWSRPHFYSSDFAETATRRLTEILQCVSASNRQIFWNCSVCCEDIGAVVSQTTVTCVLLVCESRDSVDPAYDIRAWRSSSSSCCCCCCWRQCLVVMVSGDVGPETTDKSYT